MRMTLALTPLLLGIATLAVAETEPLAPLHNPRPAPAFELVDTNGSSHSLGEYQGRVLVVNFWATWCPPCIKEMPALDSLQQQLDEHGVQVLGINMGETVEDIVGFTDRVPVGFPLLLSPDMSAGQSWGVRGLPTTYIVDPQGTIRYEILGEKPWDDPVIVGQIRALATNSVAQTPADLAITVYKSPSCGCCQDWADYLADHGFRITVHDHQDLSEIKARHGIAPSLQSCHTAEIDGYVIEGHVPVDDILRLLAERPVVTGLTAPGMPLDSPGMNSIEPKGYDVLSFDAEGNVSVYSRY